MPHRSDLPTPSIPPSWPAVDDALTQPRPGSDNDGAVQVGHLASAIRAQLAYSPETPADLDRGFSDLTRQLHPTDQVHSPTTVDDSRHSYPTDRVPGAPSRGLGIYSPPLRAAWFATALASVAVLVGVLSSRPPRPSIRPSALTYTTGVAQRATLVLADGSRATLAPQTTLRVEYNAHAQTVVLDGEALFEVRADAAVPFIVRTGHVQTRVLGTRFGVRRYAADSVARIAVAVGKVVVSTGADRVPVTLAAGMIGRANDSTIVTAVDADISPYIDWTSGKLVFRGTPVPEVLATVGHWYGYEFRIADSVLTNADLTVTIGDLSVADMFTVLKTVLNATMTFDGRVVTLHARRDTPALRKRSPTDVFTPSSREVGR